MPRRIILYGFYSLPAQLDAMKLEHVIDDLKSSHFTGLSMHLLSPWGQHPDHPWYPWVFDGTRFFLNQKNKPWYARLGEFANMMFAENLDIQICFFDQYAQEMKTPLKGVHPFTKNNLGKTIRAKALYDSWIAQIDWKEAWLHWDDKPTLGNFQPLPPFGKPLMAYITSVMDVLKKAWDANPASKSRLIWKRANETRGVMQWAGPPKNEWHADALQSMGDRMEIFRMIQLEWAKRGLTESPRFRSNNDYAAWIGERVMPAGWTPDSAYAAAMKQSLDGTKKVMRASAMEVHGVGKTLGYWGGEAVKDAAWYAANVGLLPQLELSTDGLQMGDGFEEQSRALYHSPAPTIDIKQEEKYAGYVWTNDMNRNWNKAFHPHAKLVE